VIVLNLNDAKPFITKDGSQIRSILDRTTAPVQNQSLAQATLAPGTATQPHRHPHTEEIYYLLAGTARINVQNETRDLGPLDAVLIPPDALHHITNTGSTPLVFLCCCAPPYSDKDTVMA